MTEIKERTSYIDFLRAIAILVMLLANISPYFFIENTPVAVRIMYSMAAPTFIFLSGFSAFSFSNANNYFPFWRVLFMAAFIDFCIWESMPFSTFDVLYVIALTILSVHLFKKSPGIIQHIFFIVVALLWIISSNYLPYRFEISDPKKFDIENSFTRLFIDGWFPVLPWILTGWTGAYFAKYNLIQHTWTKWIGLLIFLFGFISIYTHPLNLARESYLEIFYPVSFQFICLSIGLITITLLVLSQWNISKNNLLCVIGRNSLYAYFLHCAAISFVISKLTIEINATNMLITWSILTLLIYLLTYAREKFLPKSNELPIWLRLFTGY